MALRFLKNKFLSILLAGTVGENRTTGENRVTIFSNVFALIGLFLGGIYFFQLERFRGDGVINYLYILGGMLAASIIVLNYYGQRKFARVMAILMMNLTGWHAMIFFGKSFNGYQIFFVSIVLSITAFSSEHKRTRLTMLVMSSLCLPLADYFSHKKILPITGLNSANEPLGLLWIDTISISLLLIVVLLIERFLAEKNEADFISLNKNLEDIVKKRTSLLDTAREEAMAASRAKSRFVANTSHELRTPLNSIIGFVDLLLDPTLPETERKSFLEIIKRSGNQLLQIVNDILDLSKIEAEKMVIETRAFSPQELLGEVKTMMALKAVDKGLSFVVEDQQEFPLTVLNDPLRIKQVLVNLIGNAVKFTSKGEIVITAKTFQDEPQHVILQYDISDTGPGISTKSAESLFRPFSQVDNSLNRSFGGSGLGLSLSKSLAYLLGGELILLKSEPEKGSTFRFRIRCEVAADTGAELVTPGEYEKRELPQINAKNVLLVDDSVENQLLATQFLIRAGAGVEVAGNGQIAIELFEKNPKGFDLILMDLQMPVLDGYEATRILRERGYKIPIVAFTAHAMKDELENSRSVGFDGYLTKPIKRQVLLEKIASILKTANQNAQK